LASLASDANQGKGRRILVAEDHLINQTIIRELLQDSGVTVDVAGDGSSAVAAAQHTAYDLVLMDIHMPIMDGVEATRLLRADPKTRSLPIIALTADAMLESQEEFRAAGMDDVAAKPINVERLLTTMQRHLQQRAKSDTTPALWDQAAGIRRTGGNTTLYLRLVAAFAAQEADAATRLRALVDRGELKQADAMAHALKGVAGNLGFARLAAAAGALHDHWHLGHAGDTVALLTTFEQALSEAFAAVAAAPPANTTPTSPTKPTAPPGELP
jgi:two-component system sensor histidine kinase/response regulator